MLKKFIESEHFRILEITGIVLFFAISLVILFLTPKQPVVAPSTDTSQSSNIVAQASAMPHKGWAPMTTYFSSFGSKSQNGDIVLYEWDLDGNGLFDTDATSTDGYTSYTYAKPGEYLVTLRVTDSQGQTMTDSVVITVRHPASSSVDYQSVFDDSQVRRVDISISQSNWDYIWTDVEAKLEVPADAVIFGEELEGIGFRMRGQWSLRGSKEKKPWKIHTDAYIEGQEFHNLKQLIFTNSLEDPTMLQEKLAYDLMHFAGVPASHVCFVEIWIDFTDDTSPAIFWGVYVMIERVDNKFVGNRFGQESKGGNLYKASLAQRGPMDLVYRGDNIENYISHGDLYNIGKVNNEEEADYSDILQFIKLIDGVTYDTADDFAHALEQVFNVDEFLRYMAAAIALSGWDIYPFAGNNYYLYLNQSTEKFEWIPWDLTWGGNSQQPIFGREGTGFLQRAPLYDRVFEVQRYRDQYAAYLDLINRNWLSYENVFSLSQNYHNMIEPYIVQSTGDKMYYGSTAMFSYEQFNSSWTKFADFTLERNRYLTQKLSEYLTTSYQEEE
jgi:spore coat protein CotH